jgi:hypothetical protein
MAQAFVSYASEDQAIAQDVAAALKANGVAVWIAPDSILPGQVYNEAIVAGIRASEALCVLISPHANASKHVAREVGLADDQGKRIVPIRIAAIEPSDGLAYYLNLPQWVEWHSVGAAALAPVIALLGAAAPEQKENPAQDGGLAVLEIRRKAMATAMTRAVSIISNGFEIGKLPNGGKLELRLAHSQPHAFIAQLDYIKSEPYILNAERNGRYVVELSVPEMTDLGRQAAGLLGQKSYFTWKRLA